MNRDTVLLCCVVAAAVADALAKRRLLKALEAMPAQPSSAAAAPVVPELRVDFSVN